MTENDTNNPESNASQPAPAPETPGEAAAGQDAQPAQPAGQPEAQGAQAQAAPAQQSAQPTAPDQQPAGAYAQPAQPVQPAQPAKAGSWGWIVLGILIPLVGLILFLVWRKDKPTSAKASGIGAIIGVVLNIIATVVVTLALVPAMMAASTEVAYDTATTGTTAGTVDEAGSADDSAGTLDEDAAYDDYLQTTGSDILPELGAGTFWFEPESCYWVNEDPAEGDWRYGYWEASADDPTVIEFWGTRSPDDSDEEGELVGTISEDELRAKFEAAGWTGDVEVM